MTAAPTHEDRLAGLLLGTAVGDSLGLPAEGLGPRTIAIRWKGIWRHRFFNGRGMISDDTEHTAMVAQCLLDHPTDPEGFQRALGRRLRWWLLCLPAGVGLATARAIMKLWLGIPPTRSGVASAGNGPAMRSAVIGAFFAHDPELRRRFVEASSQITHTDPRAVIAARAVAEIAALACTRSEDPPFPRLQSLSGDLEWAKLVAALQAAHADNLSVSGLALRLGLAKGVSGYAYHSVPIAIYAWLRHRGDFSAALEQAMNCGGDTDTVGAITGALAGADIGTGGIPAQLITDIAEWPRSTRWLRALAGRLAEQTSRTEPVGPLPLFWPALPLRNLVFLLIVLIHGFARLWPHR